MKALNKVAQEFLTGKVIDDNFYDHLFLIDGTNLDIITKGDLVDIPDMKGKKITAVGFNWVSLNKGEFIFRLGDGTIDALNTTFELMDFLENHEDDDPEDDR